MKNFFRKIRQKLIAEGNLTKYLVYATGEIFLIVLGILIALQINTWNEWRKDRAKENAILNGLSKNIEIHIQTFQNDIASLRKWNHSSDIALLALQNKLDSADSLKQHFPKQGRMYLIETDLALIQECEKVLKLIQDELSS